MAEAKFRKPRKDTRSQLSAVTIGSRSDVGKRRSNNQDLHVALVRPNTPDRIDALIAVADGMGGHQAGETASRMAIRGLLSRLSLSGEGPSSEPDGYNELLPNIVGRLNFEIFETGQQPATRGMGTTLTAALLLEKKLCLSHVGDSRAYLLRNGQLRQVTQDHSWVAEMVAKGDLTEQQAREHPQRNILTRALGQHPSVEVESLVLDLDIGDEVLLCSDGLSGLVMDAEIKGFLLQEEPQVACDLLVDLANSRAGHDNITVVAMRLDGLDSCKRVGKARERRTIETQRPRNEDRKHSKGLIGAPLRIIRRLLRQ